MIIAVSGKKQSGKGSACRFLEQNALALFGKPARIFSFAGPLKRICIEVLGLTHEQVYGSDEQKNSPTRYRWEDLPHYPRSRGAARKKALDEVRRREWRGDPVYQDDLAVLTDRYTPSGFMSARQVMQEIGSMFRMMYKDVWAEACVREILSQEDVALIDDLRFVNEVEAVHRAGGRVYRLTRHPGALGRVDVDCRHGRFEVGTGGDAHVSEVELDPDHFDWSNFDWILDNAGLNQQQTSRLLAMKLHEDGLARNWRTVELEASQS